jgi:hypothetical protein
MGARRTQGPSPHPPRAAGARPRAFSAYVLAIGARPLPLRWAARGRGPVAAAAAGPRSPNPGARASGRSAIPNPSGPRDLPRRPRGALRRRPAASSVVGRRPSAIARPLLSHSICPTPRRENARRTWSHPRASCARGPDSPPPRRQDLAIVGHTRRDAGVVPTPPRPAPPWAPLDRRLPAAVRAGAAHAARGALRCGPPWRLMKMPCRRPKAPAAPRAIV